MEKEKLSKKDRKRQRLRADDWDQQQHEAKVPGSLAEPRRGD